MARDWVLEAKPPGDESGSTVYRLGLRNPKTGTIMLVVPPCRSLEDFGKELVLIKEEIDQLLVEAERRGRGLEAGAPEEQEMDPASVWQHMEQCSSEEDMFNYFNGFAESQREQIADFVFAHVSMFKGRGPVFAEHYSAESHTLA